MAYGLQYVLKLFSSLQLLTVISNTSDFSRKSGSLPMNIDSPKNHMKFIYFAVWLHTFSKQKSNHYHDIFTWAEC